MPRIDIELTSSRPDGTWTWRAAGARQPKGTLDGSMLTGGAKVGDVVRADVEVDVDGMSVVGVLPPKTKRESQPRLEVLGPPRTEREEAPVIGSTRPAADGPAGDGSRRGGGGPRRDGPAGTASPRRERPGPARPAGGRPGGGGPAGARHGGPGGRPERPAPPRGDRAARPRERPSREARPAPAPLASRTRAKRLNPGRVHRDQVLATLPPEEQPVAEQLLRGGIPALRHALEEQNAAARATGAPEVKADALLALAERLMPRLRAAEWLDRAEAALAQADEVAIRDLRALVAGADAGRDELSRELAGRLREVLDQRSAKEREAWLQEITEALEAGRVVRALRSSTRPPEPGVRFPPPLAERLSAAAGQALAPDVAPDRWMAVLEAVTASPVRRTVRPTGLPSEAPPELVQAARQASERVPGLGALVGMPAPSAGARRPAGAPSGRTRRPAGSPEGVRPPGPPGPPPPPSRPAPPVPDPGAVAEAEAAGPPGTQDEAPGPGPEQSQADAAAPVPQQTQDEAAAPVPPPATSDAAEASGDNGDDAVLVEELG